MGTSSTERVALLFETRADLSGIKETRAETSALAQDAARAGQAVAAGAKAAATANTALAAATAEAQAEQSKMVATLDQVREAQKRSGGDFEQFKKELAALVTGQTALAQAASNATDQVERQRRAVATFGTAQLGPGLPGTAAGGGFSRQMALSEAAAYRADAQRTAPTGPQLGPALPGLTTAAAAAASAHAAALEKVDVNARKAGNAMNIMAASAAAGQGSVAGLATAAGNVAQEMALMSKNAGIAANAAGIGVLIGAIGVLIAVSIEAKRALSEIPDGKLSGAIDAHLKNLHSEAQIKTEIAQIDARRAALEAQALTNAQRIAAIALDPKGGYGVQEEEKQRLQAIVNLDAARTAAFKRGEEIENEERQRRLRSIAISADAQTTATARYDAQLRKIEAERVESIRSHELTEKAANERAATQQRSLAKTSSDYVMQLGTEVATAADQLTKNEFDRRKRAEDVRFQDEERAAKSLTLSETDAARAAELRMLHHTAIVGLIEKEQKLAQDAARTSVGLGSDNLVTRYNARMEQIEAERKAQIKATGDEVTANAAAEQKKQALRRQTAIQAAADAKTIIDVLLASNSKQVHAVGAVGETIRRVIIGAQAAHAAVEAAIEGGKAIGSAAIGDFRGAALHGAAALELAKAAALGGQEALSPRTAAGGGGGGGAGGADAPVFQPRDSGAGGEQVIVLQTVDPYSREKINEVRYLVGRAGALKRPIQIPPTAGLDRVA